jgi:hypothetical protein
MGIVATNKLGEALCSELYANRFVTRHRPLGRPHHDMADLEDKR